jgi:hypothetical protein
MQLGQVQYGQHAVRNEEEDVLLPHTNCSNENPLNVTPPFMNMYNFSWELVAKIYPSISFTQTSGVCTPRSLQL